MTWLIIALANGLLPAHHQTIIQTNVDFLSITPRTINPNKKMIEINQVSLMKLHLKIIICNFTSILSKERWVNSSPPSAAYMRQWTESALVQIMAGRLFGAKPLSKPMLLYCQLDP